MRIPFLDVPNQATAQGYAIQPFGRGSVVPLADGSDPLAWSAHAGADAFAPQLLARHLHDEGLEIQAGQVFADMRQPVRQILAHTILSAPRTLGF